MRLPRLAPVVPLALATLLAACASSAPAEPPPPTPLEIVAAQQAAWNAGDLDAFMAGGYHDSPALTFFSGGSWTTGYQPVLDRYRRRYVEGGAEMGRLVFSRLEALELGADHALVRGRWDLDFAAQDDVGGLFTLLFRRFPQGWRIVHDHSSADAPPAE